MARRKRQFLEDDDSDSSVGSDDAPEVDDLNDPDAREERALFDDPYQRKRRRKNGKDDALYGVFAEDSEEEGFGGKKGKGKAAGEKRSDWTKAPAFVSGEKKVDLEEEMDVDGDSSDDGKEGSQQDDAEGEYDSDDFDASKPPSPRVREDEEEEEVKEEQPPAKPRIGGIGFGASSGQSKSAFTAFTKGGIGSSRPAEPQPSSSSTPPPPKPTVQGDLPASFGAARTQRSFLPNNGSPAPSAAPLSAAERAHFNKLQGSFGARMLEKMGWQAGTGLGAAGEGIVTPVESKLRPQKMGIAFKGFKEKTEHSKAEARRKGEVVSDDEDVRPRKGGKRAEKAQQEKRSDAWKKPKKVKTRVEHKTYEQIVAEAGQQAPAAGLGQIIDATGATPREVASLADVSLSSWTPSTDPTRIPEVRHNLRLIGDACTSDLDGLAREARALEERKKWIANEDIRLRKKVEEEAELISRLQQVHLVVDEINAQAKELASVYEATLEPFQSHFYKLISQFPEEFDKYRLDDVVVGAIAPIFRRMVTQWHPLEDPTAFITLFRSWRRALKMNLVNEDIASQVDVYGSKTIDPVQVEKPMTPFESLLWHVWLPKVRSTINNDWSPQDPHPAVRLYEAWSSLLPPFIRDNFLDQLILPKVHSAVADWNPKKDKVPLQTLVFPWLPHVGLRLEEVVGDARRKVKGLLRAWTVEEDVPKDLIAWKDVFDAGDWDNMLLKYVVPKLGATLRNDFRVNPRAQDMAPFQHVLAWYDTLRPSVFAQILETEFFPKWLDVLHVWLIQPRVSTTEVADWFDRWKDTLPKSAQALPGIANGFTRGLQLMNKALELGPNAPTQLPRPDHSAPQTLESLGAKRDVPAKARPARTQEITFRSVVEEFAAAHNLLFIPTGRAHELSRMPLFRVSATADGRGGLLVYLLDDAVWAPSPDGYRAVSLEDMVLRANQ